MTFESYTVADISTAHMHESDGAILDHVLSGDIDHDIVVIGTEYGWLVHVGQIPGDEGDEPYDIGYPWLASGLSQIFVDRCIEAQGEGHLWVNWDQDGTEYEDLPKGEWK